MTRKKGVFLTFIFSLIPGAGEMYLGFYKMGASIMILFWGGVAFFGALLPPLLYLLPILWFYSFFHTNNLNGMPDDEFYAVEDDYLFSLGPQTLGVLGSRYKKQCGLVLILLGISVAWGGLWECIGGVMKLLNLSNTLFNSIYQWHDSLSQLIAAAVIIVLGWKLFKAKQESLKTPPYLPDGINGPDKPET